MEKRVSKGLAGLGVGLAYRTAILALARSLAPPGNFARTFGAELAAKLGGGSAHWSQLWICVVALPVGGVVAVYAYDVLIAGRPLMAASTGPGPHRNCDGEAGLTDRTAGCRCGLRPARGHTFLRSGSPPADTRAYLHGSPGGGCRCGSSSATASPSACPPGAGECAASSWNAMSSWITGSLSLVAFLLFHLWVLLAGITMAVRPAVPIAAPTQPELSDALPHAAA